MTKLKQQIKKTALYFRLSRDDEYSGDSVSIQTKKTMLSQFTKERGFTNCEYFVDDGYSGTNFNRPDFQRMLGMVEEGKVGVICVKNLSRLAKTQRKSFRNKRIVHTSENEWLITEDTHEALANQATIEAVQQRIQVKQPRLRLNP